MWLKNDIIGGVMKREKKAECMRPRRFFGRCIQCLRPFFSFLKGESYARRSNECLYRRDEREGHFLYSFASIRDAAISDFGSIRMLARECANERSRDSGTLSEDSIRRESHALITAAKKCGLYLEAKDIPGTRYTIRTGESEVRLVQKEQYYYKLKNPFAKLHLKKHPAEVVLFEHIVHNILFPDCRLEFLGICEDFHEARIVLRQRAVRSDTRPTDAQIKEELAMYGLAPEDRYAFGNKYLFVTDVGQDGDNVLVDDDGYLRFIDPIIGIKEPLRCDLDEIIKTNDEQKTTVLVQQLCAQ